MPSSLCANLAIVIKVVNYIESGASNTRLFLQICEEMDATHQSLLFLTQVLWSSKGNILARLFELKEEVDSFFKIRWISYLNLTNQNLSLTWHTRRQSLA